MAFRKATYNENAKIATVEPIRKKEDIAKIRKWFIVNDYKKYEVLFMLGCYTGLRAGDIVKLKVEDVKDGNEIKEQLVMREQKTAKIKILAINPYLKTILKDWCKDRDPGDYLFEGRNSGMPIDRSQVYRMIVTACEELKIKVNVGTHTMRKTFGYHHYKQFQDIALLQEIFNHSGPDVTRRYIGITQDEINESYKALSLEDVDDSLEARAESLRGNNRTRMEAVKLFIKEYLHKTRYSGVFAPFAIMILEILTNQPAYEERKLMEEKRAAEKDLKTLIYEIHTKEHSPQQIKNAIIALREEYPQAA